MGAYNNSYLRDYTMNLSNKVTFYTVISWNNQVSILLTSITIKLLVFVFIKIIFDPRLGESEGMQMIFMFDNRW